MRKIPSLYIRDWMGVYGPPGRLVTPDPHPDCDWVFRGEGIATRKLDGSCCLIRSGILYKRQEVQKGKTPPSNFELVDQDLETGKQIGWVLVGEGPEDKWHREALKLVGPDSYVDGTYELVGPKVQGNPEHFELHTLVNHDNTTLVLSNVPTDFDELLVYFPELDIEGIVWHHPDGRMAKIKAKDFGLKRGTARLAHEGVNSLIR